MSLFYALLMACFIAPGLVLLSVRAGVSATVALFHAGRLLVQLARFVYYRRRAMGVSLGGLLLLAGIGMFSSPTVQAGEVKCVDDQPTYLETYQIPQAGRPGLVFVGAHNPDETIGSFLTPTGWTQYEGGLYQPYLRYDNGLPPSVTIKSILPSTDRSTVTEQGWSIYVGYGVLTPEAMDQVKNRRDALNEIKPQRVAEGKWDPSYDSDDSFKLALVQKNMTDNNQILKSVAPVPLIVCAPTNGAN